MNLKQNKLTIQSRPLFTFEQNTDHTTKLSTDPTTTLTITTMVTVLSKDKRSSYK